MLTTVMLYGPMGKKFGRTWKLDIATPAEAIRALIANRPDLREWLDKRRDHPFQVLVGKDREDIGENQLFDPLGGQTLRIIPCVKGAKSDGVQMIVGAVLIVVGVAINVFSDGAASPIGNAFIAAGIGMVLGGISQWLFSPPSAGDPPEKPGNKPSYLFAGPVNTTAQGQVVPVGYGKLKVGSAVISGSIKNEDYTPSGGFGGGSGGGLCPVAETPILMADGTEKLAGELVTGDMVRTQHESSLEWMDASVEILGRNDAHCHRVTLEDGREITVASPHRFLRYQEDVDVFDYCEASLLKAGDVLEGFKAGVVSSSEYAGRRETIWIKTNTARTYQTAGITSHNVKVILDVTDA